MRVCCNNPKYALYTYTLLLYIINCTVHTPLLQKLFFAMASILVRVNRGASAQTSAQRTYLLQYNNSILLGMSSVSL